MKLPYKGWKGGCEKSSQNESKKKTVEAEFGVPEMTEERRRIEGFSAPEDDPPSTPDILNLPTMVRRDGGY